MRVRRGLCCLALACLLAGLFPARAAQPEGYMLYQRPGAYSLLVPSGSRYFRKENLSGQDTGNRLADLIYDLGIPGNLRYFDRRDSGIALAAMVLPNPFPLSPLLFESVELPLQLEMTRALQPNRTWRLDPHPYTQGGNRWRRMDGADDPENPADIISYLYMPKGRRVCVLIFLGILSGQDSREAYEDIVLRAAESFRLSASINPPEN